MFHKWLLMCVLFISNFAAGVVRADDDLGIFERILEASGTFEETNAAFERALATSKLTLHAKHDLKTPDGVQKARIYVLTSNAYLEAAKSAPPKALSAQILRAAVYQYGAGRKTMINMTNPTAHAMVYYAGLSNYPQLVNAARATAQEIRDVAARVPGKAVSVQLEPKRSESTLNEFNGDGPAKMMAKWRNWEESQNVILDGSASDYGAMVARVEKALSNSRATGIDDPAGWKQIVKIAIGNATYFGISNDYTENKCVRINSDFRSDGKANDAPFPGVDHATALPLEILVINDGNKTRVVQYGEMWRMQLYFWDSGYMAFAKNTLVPSAIFDSIEAMVSGK